MNKSKKAIADLNEIKEKIIPAIARMYGSGFSSVFACEKVGEKFDNAIELLKEHKADIEELTKQQDIRCDACAKRLELLKEKQWIPVSKRLPDSNVEVLVSCYETNFKGEREYRTTIAVYIPRFTIRSCDKFDGSGDIESVEEYNEEVREYYVREGLFEETYDGTTFEGKSFVLYGEVVAWKPKPQPWKDYEQE